MLRQYCMCTLEPCMPRRRLACLLGGATAARLPLQVEEQGATCWQPHLFWTRCTAAGTMHSHAHCIVAAWAARPALRRGSVACTDCGPTQHWTACRSSLGEAAGSAWQLQITPKAFALMHGRLGITDLEAARTFGGRHAQCGSRYGTAALPQLCQQPSRAAEGLASPPQATTWPGRW